MPTVESTSAMTVDVLDEENHEVSLLLPRLLSLRLEQQQGSRQAENRGRVAVVVLAEEEVRGGGWRVER